MDEFFDRLKDGAYKAKGGAERLAKEVAKRTSNAITYTKLSFSLNETQSKINEIYTEMGKTLYEKYLETEDFDPEFKVPLEQIDKLTDDAAVIAEQLAELRNSLKCPECGTLNPSDADYCKKCGSRLADDEDTDTEYDGFEDDGGMDDIPDDDEEIIIINPKKPE